MSQKHFNNNAQATQKTHVDVPATKKKFWHFRIDRGCFQQETLYMKRKFYSVHVNEAHVTVNSLRKNVLPLCC